MNVKIAKNNNILIISCVYNFKKCCLNIHCLKALAKHSLLTKTIQISIFCKDFNKTIYTNSFDLETTKN